VGKFSQAPRAHGRCRRRIRKWDTVGGHGHLLRRGQVVKKSQRKLKLPFQPGRLRDTTGQVVSKKQEIAKFLSRNLAAGFRLGPAPPFGREQEEHFHEGKKEVCKRKALPRAVLRELIRLLKRGRRGGTGKGPGRGVTGEWGVTNSNVVFVEKGEKRTVGGRKLRQRRKLGGV